MTPIVDLVDEEVIYNILIEEGKEEEFILDLSNPVKSRIDVLEKYFIKNEMATIELLHRLNSMWFMCGIKAIENFFVALCDSDNISSLLKLSVAKSLSDSENKEPAKKTLISILNTRELPTPCRVEAIELLVQFNTDNSIVFKYFKEFLLDISIDEEFKYKTILNLENLASIWIRDKLYDLFSDKEFVKYIFTISDRLIKQEFPKFKPELDNEDFFELLILRMNYATLTDAYKSYCDSNPSKYDYLILQSQWQFFNMTENSIFYRILSAQYLLQKFFQILSKQDIENIENILLEFAENPINGENQRADAADTLLHLGSSIMKDKCKDIILSLGMGDREINTLYTNSQNVHNKELENSIVEIIEFFAEYTTVMINKIPITFKEVRTQIEFMANENKVDKEKIQISLNRIHMDRALFSKYNISLETLLLKLWSYIQNTQEYKEELILRLLQELEDMAGTCSSGFASRLVNVVSGFEDFTLKISWEDQIISNFNGRLNAMARNITLQHSIFRNHYYDNVSFLQKEIVDSNSIDSVLESFRHCVLNELPLKSSEPYKRKNFNFFLKHSFPIIRQEMYQEFSPFMDDTTFDLYFRKALMHYEGEC
jgi:hypothetical protein